MEEEKQTQVRAQSVFMPSNVYYQGLTPGLPEQIFFEDGKSPSNVGFFNDNKVRSDAKNLLGGYRTTRTGYNDCVMRIAVAKTPTQPYSLLGWGKPKKFNCQDFAEAVRTLYSNLVRDPAIQKKCCPKKEEIK